MQASLHTTTSSRLPGQWLSSSEGIANPDTRGSLRETGRLPIKENPAYAR